MRWLLVVLVVLGCGLAGCSGVPSASAPEVVRTLARAAAPSPESTITPVPNSDPRSIVNDFLAANLGEDARHTAARAFLTQDARNKWTDTTVTVVDDFQVSVADPASGSVTVNASQLGSVDQSGVFRPVLQGEGATPVTFTFGMQQVGGQWRISQLANGLLVNRQGFSSTYVARSLYFFNQAQQRLVPDPRYSALTDQPLCNWLLAQLADGPRAELQSAVTSDFPAQNSRAGVTFNRSGAVVVDLPGISQQDRQTVDRLAAQLAFTFQLDPSTSLQITDGTKAVPVQGSSGPFNIGQFSSFSAGLAQPALYYLHGGGIVDDSGAPLAGPAGSASYHLASFAIASSRGAGPLLVAGATGSTTGNGLLVGDVVKGLSPVSLPPGQLSRPVWAPGLAETWIGDGAGLLRVAGGVVSTVPAAGRAGAGGGRISAVSFSPDGVRIALVITPGDGTSQLWLGSVVRSGAQVRIDGLEPITPPGLVLSDVAWNDAKTLYATGTFAARPAAFGIWSVQVDGSSLSSRSVAGLPNSAPDAITAAPNSVPWVSASTALFVQRNGIWASPGAQTETTYGTAPSYLQ